MDRAARPIVVLLLIGLLAFSVGCGGSRAVVPPPVTAEVTVYFFLNSDGTTLEPVVREVTLKEDNLEARLCAAMEELLKGPSAEEAGRLYSQLPADVKLLSVEVSPPYATLDFSAELEQIGGSARVFGVLEQLTYTGTEFEEITDLVLEVEGVQVGTDERPFAGEGVLFDTLTRQGDRPQQT
ncbi:MAG: GerMN domain-containing protein [Bacillota bacterium]